MGKVLQLKMKSASTLKRMYFPSLLTFSFFLKSESNS
jgi:hypothetical protein